jgi:hypothetical protein
MRLYGLSPAAIAAMVTLSRVSRWDPQGRPVFAGKSADGRRIEIVMALDEPDYVITVFGEVD